MDRSGGVGERKRESKKARKQESKRSIATCNQPVVLRTNGTDNNANYDRADGLAHVVAGGHELSRHIVYLAY